MYIDFERTNTAAATRYTNNLNSFACSHPYPSSYACGNISYVQCNLSSAIDDEKALTTLLAWRIGTTYKNAFASRFLDLSCWPILSEKESFFIIYEVYPFHQLTHEKMWTILVSCQVVRIAVCCKEVQPRTTIYNVSFTKLHETYNAKAETGGSKSQNRASDTVQLSPLVDCHQEKGTVWYSKLFHKKILT